MSITKCRAIVIHTIDYSENSVVLKCYTDEFGLQSYMVNGVRSKKGTIRASQLQPLSLLELEAYHHQSKNLQRIKELKCSPILQHLHYDIRKSSVGIFMAETLGKCIREDNHPDKELFSFLFHSIQILDLQESPVTNFPVYFLSQLSRYLGFFPKGSFTELTNGFDIKEGLFEAYDPRNIYQIPELCSSFLSSLLSVNMESYHLVPIGYPQRTELLEWLMLYYREHVNNFSELKSHKILNEVFS